MCRQLRWLVVSQHYDCAYGMSRPKKWSVGEKCVNGVVQKSLEKKPHNEFKTVSQFYGKIENGK
jgi:hypothetical protein